MIRREVHPRIHGALDGPGAGSYRAPMTVRDLRTVQRVEALPFSGYARRRGLPYAPDVDRVVACVALLAAMVVSGIALGSPRRPTDADDARSRFSAARRRLLA
jgi:hypothetical protein